MILLWHNTKRKL